MTTPARPLAVGGGRGTHMRHALLLGTNTAAGWWRATVAVGVVVAVGRRDVVGVVVVALGSGVGDVHKGGAGAVPVVAARAVAVAGVGCTPR